MEAKSYQLQCFIACKSLNIKKNPEHMSKYAKTFQYTYFFFHSPPVVTDAVHLALIPTLLIY